MISKRDLAERLCEVEELVYYLSTDLDKLERRVKKLEPKKERKSKNAKLSK